MTLQTRTVWLRIRLTDVSLEQFKSRANARARTYSEYAVAIIHYSMQEPDRVPSSPFENASSHDEIYFPVEISPATRQKLIHWSERYAWNLASFSGLLIESYLRRFENDPSDLMIVARLSRLMEETGRVSEIDLVQTFREHGFHQSRFSPAYLAKWYFSRVKPLAPKIEKDGQLVDLTAQMVETALQKSK